MKKILVIFAFGIAAGNIGFAQKQKSTMPAATTSEAETTDATPHSGLKFGWIASGELLAQMPDKIKADTELNRYARDFQNQIESMGKEYESKVQDYQAKEKTMSDPIKEVKQKEIQDLGNRIQSIQQSAKEKVNQKQQDLYDPILKKAEKAINDVAREKAYDYIFDKAGGALLYGREADNILPYVKAKMGIK